MENQFNVAAVKEKAAKALLQSANDPEASRQIYLEEIMDWTDYYTENFKDSSDIDKNLGAQKVFNSITDLWLEFAAFEITLRQFKKAVDIYEKAVNDPIVSFSTRIYLSYADFCVERGKLVNARKVYLKAIQQPFSEADRSIIWSRFLVIMHKINKSEELTIEQLFLAVQQQLASTAAADTSSDSRMHLLPPPNIMHTSLTPVPHHATSSTSTSTFSSSSSSSSSSLLSTVVNPLPSPSAVALEPTGTTASCGTLSHIHGSSTSSGTNSEAEGKEPSQSANSEMVVDNATVDGGTRDGAAVVSGVAGGDDLDAVGDMTPEQIVTLFNRRPPMLFVATNREPMVSGLRSLDVQLVAELETFLGSPLSSLVSSVGSSPSQDTESDANLGSVRSNPAAVDAYLDLLEGLWAAQALKERHFDAWMADLHKMHVKEENEIRRQLFRGEGFDKRDIMNEPEYRRFASRCAVQKELVLSIINKTMYSMLLEQQSILTEIGFPRFNAAFIEQLQSFVERRRVLPSTAQSGQPPPVEFEYSPVIVDTIANQRKMVCAFLSLRLFAVNEERSRLQAVANRMKAASASSRVGGSEALNGTGKGKPLLAAAGDARMSGAEGGMPSLTIPPPRLLTTDSSVGADTVSDMSPTSPSSSGGFDSDVQAGDGSDYYSAEAKKRRRKRRLTSGNPSSEGPLEEGARYSGLSSNFVASYSDRDSRNQYNNRYESGAVGMNDNRPAVDPFGRIPREDALVKHTPLLDASKNPLLQKLAVMWKQQGHRVG